MDFCSGGSLQDIYNGINAIALRTEMVYYTVHVCCSTWAWNSHKVLVRYFSNWTTRRKTNSLHVLWNIKGNPNLNTKSFQKLSYSDHRVGLEIGAMRVKACCGQISLTTYINWLFFLKKLGWANLTWPRPHPSSVVPELCVLLAEQ